MSSVREAIENIKQNGFDLDFGGVFNHAFEVYKKIAMTAGAALLLFSFIIVGLVGAVVFGSMAIADFSVDQMEKFDVRNFSLAGLLLYVLTLIFIGCLAAPMNAGLLKMSRNASKNEEFSLGTVFEYYGNKYFITIIIATLVLTGFSTTINVGFSLIGYEILGALMNIVISFFTGLTIPLIIFGNLNPLEAIQGSIAIVSKQFFIILGLLIVSALFSVIGIFGFCIGIFFTIPIMNAMTYTIYASVLNDDDNVDMSNVQENIEVEE